MKKKKTKIHLAIDVLRKALKKDPDYRIGWQANIAMAFVDEARRNKKEIRGSYKNVHKAANKAANTFLENLIRS